MHPTLTLGWSVTSNVLEPCLVVWDLTCRDVAIVIGSMCRATTCAGNVVLVTSTLFLLRCTYVSHPSHPPCHLHGYLATAHTACEECVLVRCRATCEAHRAHHNIRTREYLRSQTRGGNHAYYCDQDVQTSVPVMCRLMFMRRHVGLRRHVCMKYHVAHAALLVRTMARVCVMARVPRSHVATLRAGVVPAGRSSEFRGVTKHRWTGRFEAHLWDSASERKNVVPGGRAKGKQVYYGGLSQPQLTPFNSKE